MSASDYIALSFLAVCALWGVTNSYNRLRHILCGLLVGCFILALVGWLGPRFLPTGTAELVQGGRVIPCLADHAQTAVGFLGSLLDHSG